MTGGRIVGLGKNASHSFSKKNCDKIVLIAGHGVEGDAHAGKTVKHRSRVAVDPNQPNLRQVHLLHNELLHELSGKGFEINGGQLGENILTQDINLLGLSRGTMLHIGSNAVIEITGLRNPCSQIEDFAEGLLKELVYKDAQGKMIRRAGVMAVVQQSGEVRLGDIIKIGATPSKHNPLERV